jgi:hypothetical protein
LQVAVTNIGTFKEKQLVDVTREDLELGEEDEAEAKKVRVRR